MKVIYETIDGRQFSQAADAEQHERRLNAQIKMWGFDGNPTNDCDLARVVYLKGSYAADLFKQMNEGDESAREKIIQGNLRLVLSVIQRFGGRRRKF